MRLDISIWNSNIMHTVLTSINSEKGLCFEGFSLFLISFLRWSFAWLSEWCRHKGDLVGGRACRFILMCMLVNCSDPATSVWHGELKGACLGLDSDIAKDDSLRE